MGSAMGQAAGKPSAIACVVAQWLSAHECNVPWHSEMPRNFWPSSSWASPGLQQFATQCQIVDVTFCFLHHKGVLLYPIHW